MSVTFLGNNWLKFLVFVGCYDIKNLRALRRASLRRAWSAIQTIASPPDASSNKRVFSWSLKKPTHQNKQFMEKYNYNELVITNTFWQHFCICYKSVLTSSWNGKSCFTGSYYFGIQQNHKISKTEIKASN